MRASSNPVSRDRYSLRPQLLDQAQAVEVERLTAKLVSVDRELDGHPPGDLATRGRDALVPTQVGRRHDRLGPGVVVAWCEVDELDVPVREGLERGRIELPGAVAATKCPPARDAVEHALLRKRGQGGIQATFVLGANVLLDDAADVIGVHGGTVAHAATPLWRGEGAAGASCTDEGPTDCERG